MDFFATPSTMNPTTVPSVDLDPVVLEHLTSVLNDAIQEILCSEDEEGGRKEIELPSSLSLPQVEFVLNLVAQAKEIQVELKWFFPMFSIILKRKPAKPVSKRSPPIPPPGLSTSRRRSPVPLGPFTVYVNFPQNLRDAFNKFALMKTRRASPFYQRPSEPFQSNFNIITYINTEPLVPTKFAPKVGLASLLLGQQGGGMVGGGGVQHPLGPGTSYLQPIGGGGDGGGGGQFELSEADQLLLEQLSGVDRIHVVSGLCKVDKLDLALLLNNEAFLEQKPCRIIYLQSMSILTFWMALKVKELCGDYHWNSSGYQITLESKSSPNNNIIFFELSTFMRALNLNIDTSLVTHLIVDIDHADHVFFNLFLLYIKTNFDSLRHLRLIIFGHDHKQARALYDYFAPEIVNLIDWMDFHEHVIPEMLGGLQTGYVEPVNVVHLYLEDIGHYLSPKGESLDSGTNPELERLLPRVLHANSNISPSVMIEFISAFPVLINYQCHYLNGLTPLIVTVLRGTVDQLYSILAAGANAHLASWNGTTPIEWAIQAKRDEQFHLLMVHLSATNISFDLNLKQHYANKFVNAALNVGDLDAKIREILVKKVQQSPPLYDVDYSVILRLLLGMIRQLNQSHQPNTPLGTVLVLLPSYNVISTLRKQIIASLAPNCEYPFTTFCLYPHLPNNELDIAVSLFNSVGGSQVRIILSTFTLDCLLLSDIRYVINTGIRLSKVQSGFTPTSQYRLVPNQLSEKVSEYRYYRDLFDQSTGTPVYIYNLYSRADVLNHQLVGSEENDEPDLGYAETDSIYNCVFASKYFKLKADQKIGDLFGLMVSAPPKLVIDNAVYFLKSLNMFDDKERFNELGRILVDLSIEPHYGKMIIYSVLLRCLDPILTIVCALSSPNCFEITSANSAQRALDMQSLYELSHQSFSDHLTYVYAFQKWQELCRSNPKNVSYDRSGIVLFSSFELIYSLRTKVLGQLRACGFVKGKGTMNIRQLNANSDNFTLVKAAICAGQSKDNLALIHRDHVPRLVHRDDREEPFTYLHPNSVLSHQLVSGKGASQLTANLVMFDRKVTSGQVSYLSNCTLVNPLTVAIFTDENRPDQIVLKDNCIQLGSSSHGLKITGEDVSQCFELRTRWQQYAKKRIINMHTPVSEDENMMIAELVRFCSMSDEQNGFGDHREIGRAPQVMSTYFCSTKMIAPGAAAPN